LPRIERRGSVDGVGEVVGLGEQMARTSGWHRPKCITVTRGVTPPTGAAVVTPT
jgi:hypothetical protein